MPKNSSTKSTAEKCPGGRSFGRKRGAHDKGDDVRCYRCKATMGCIHCCESPQDLICLVCHNWADKRGVKQHGNVVLSEKVPHVRTDQGWRHWEPNKDSKSADQIVRKLVEEKRI